ncbi:hypothetical protein ACWGH5_39745 [Streptomyces sp. NPDC054864]
MEKRVGHVERLMNRTLPADFPDPVERGGAGDVLAVLALSESIRRDLAARRAGDIREAVLLGATWSEVAAAIDTAPDESRAILRDWTERQHGLYQINAEPGATQRLATEEDRHAAMLALINWKTISGQRSACMTELVLGGLRRFRSVILSGRFTVLPMS